MNQDKILEELKELAANYFSIDPEFITSEATPSSLGMDSLDEIELLMQIEEKYDIEIPDGDAMLLDDFGKLVDYIITHA